MKNQKLYHQKKDDKNVSIEQTSAYSGPIPCPEDLEKYELVKPGFADRLIQMAEKEQEHRQELVRKQAEENIKLQYKDISTFRRGQWFALIALAMLVALCAYGFYLGYEGAASGIAVSVIIGVVSAFLLANKNNKDNKPAS